MAATERIRLGAPFEVTRAISPKRRLTTVVVDAFDVEVPVVARADATPVATLAVDGFDHECVHVEGRLFRPLLNFGGHPCTVRWLAEDAPPTFGLEAHWSAAFGFRTTLLGSPWRPWRGWEMGGWPGGPPRGAPERSRMAETVQAAADGLRVMDGTVFRETRAPTWCVGVDDRTTRLWFPDELKRPPPALVDIRAPLDRVLALAAEFGFPHVAAATLPRRRVVGFWAPRRLDRVVVHEPTLLPDTAEADSLASLCLWLMAGASERPAEDDYGATRDHLVRTVEDALRRGAPLDDGYRMVTDLAACEVDGPAATKHHRAPAIRGVAGAKMFLRLRETFGRTPATPAPAEDAEDPVEVAFRP